MDMDSMVEKSEKWFGVSITTWIEILKTLGVPTMLLAFICFLTYRVLTEYAPPIVNAHIKLLEKTSATLDSMDKTLQQSNKMIEEIVDVEQQTQQFMDRVAAEHKEQQNSLNKIYEKVNQ